MRTLYLDCGMGAAGDMLTAALLELFDEPNKMVRELAKLRIPGVRFLAERAQKCGIYGTHMRVIVWDMEEDEHLHSHHHHHDNDHGHDHHHDHTHGGMADIAHIISHLNISDKVRRDVLAVYDLIAQAESHAHGVPVNQIHFHEVGTMDAIADVTAVCYLMDKLGIDKVYASPVHVGSGQVRCAHGILPVPAPATAHILQGCPIYGGKIKGELCTPTGAALLKYFADSFGHMPVMSISSIGYGMGKKDFEAANCVRTMLGETDASKDVIYELNCNVDDMTAEQIGFALECCFKAGAVEAFTIPINMKKSRPGTLIRVICKEDLKETLIHTIFKYTSTAGIRETRVERSVLERSITELETPYGIIRRKDYSGYGVARSKFEYDDLARAALEHQMSIPEILKNIEG